MISILVPFTPGDPHRDAAWEFLRPRWEQFGEVIEGRCEGPWVKATAVADALSRASGDKFIIPDADVWCDPTEALEHCETWATPHHKVHRLSEASTELVINGAEWRGLPLDSSNRQDAKPYAGIEGGGITIIARDAYNEAPMDPRFTGWGQEDLSWARALRTLVGPPWRGGEDLVHLWHPPQARKSRTIGSAGSATLAARYKRANGHPTAMRALIEEAR